jgi:hypothetical protein
MHHDKMATHPAGLPLLQVLCVDAANDGQLCNCLLHNFSNCGPVMTNGCVIVYFIVFHTGQRQCLFITYLKSGKGRQGNFSYQPLLHKFKPFAHGQALP